MTRLPSKFHTVQSYPLELNIYYYIQEMPSFRECFCYHDLFIFYNLQSDFTNIISLKSGINSVKKQTLNVFIYGWGN